MGKLEFSLGWHQDKLRAFNFYANHDRSLSTSCFNMYHPFPAKDQNRIQISLSDKLQKFKNSLKVTQMAQNTKVAIGVF
jgi:hypothetical protein